MPGSSGRGSHAHEGEQEMTNATTTLPAAADLDEIVSAQVAAALGLDPEEVTPEATLVTDLGAESLDMLDMLFRIEKKAGIKITMAQITGLLQGDLSNEEFVTPEGYVSAAGLAQLKDALPQIDADALAGKLEDSSIFALFTVQNLIDMVKSGAANNAG
jgi:acyl carrier protein